MSNDEGGNHDEEEEDRQWKDREEVGVEAYECIDCEEGKCVRPLSTGQEPDHTDLEDKEDSYSGVESAKVV